MLVALIVVIVVVVAVAGVAAYRLTKTTSNATVTLNVVTYNVINKASKCAKAFLLRPKAAGNAAPSPLPGGSCIRGARTSHLSQ